MKRIIIIGGIVIVAFISVAIIIRLLERRKAKKLLEDSEDPVTQYVPPSQQITPPEEQLLQIDRVNETEDIFKDISANTTIYLSELAEDLHEDIYDTPITGHDYALYSKALNLNKDIYLFFLLIVYRRKFGEWLWEDMKGEFYITGSGITNALNERNVKVIKKYAT